MARLGPDVVDRRALFPTSDVGDLLTVELSFRASLGMFATPT